MKWTVEVEVDDAVCEAVVKEESGKEKHFTAQTVNGLMLRIQTLLEKQLQEAGLAV